jgi:hypothetical protein
MSAQLIALLMFLLLTYLLFRRPASSALRRLPSELHIQVSPSVYLKNESPNEKSTSAADGSGIDRSLPWKLAPGIALILLTGIAAVAQTPAGAQAQLSVAGNNFKADREDEEDKKEGGAANDRAKDSRDGSAIPEEIGGMKESRS